MEGFFIFCMEIFYPCIQKLSTINKNLVSQASLGAKIFSIIKNDQRPTRRHYSAASWAIEFIAVRIYLGPNSPGKQSTFNKNLSL